MLKKLFATIVFQKYQSGKITSGRNMIKYTVYCILISFKNVSKKCRKRFVISR